METEVIRLRDQLEAEGLDEVTTRYNTYFLVLFVPKEWSMVEKDDREYSTTTKPDVLVSSSAVLFCCDCPNRMAVVFGLCGEIRLAGLSLHVLAALYASLRRGAC